MLKKITTALIIATSCFACGTSDETPPVISILEPLDGTQVERGKSFKLMCKVTDNEALGRISITGDLALNEITNFDSPTLHEFTANVAVPATAIPGTPINIKIEAKDKAENASSQAKVVLVK